MNTRNNGIETVVAAITIIPLSAVLRGWALSTLWAWFVVPLGVPAVGLAHAVGLGLILRYLCGSGADSKGDIDTENPVLHMATYAVVMPLFMVGVGAIVHHFM